MVRGLKIVGMQQLNWHRPTQQSSHIGSKLIMVEMALMFASNAPSPLIHAGPHCTSRQGHRCQHSSLPVQEQRMDQAEQVELLNNFNMQRSTAESR